MNRKHLFADGPLIVLALLLIVVVNLNISWHWSAATDRFWYDRLMLFSGQQVSDDIHIIEIDDQSLSLIGDWPWDRAFHAELIDILTAANADVVAYNLAFTAGNAPLNASDYLLADSIERSGRVILPVYFGQIFNNGPLELVLPASVFAEHAHLGHVNVYLDQDGVYRRLNVNDVYGSHDWPHFSLAALAVAEPNKAERYRALSSLLIRFVDPDRAFRRHSFVDVITGEVDPAEFYQKKVFVGVTATSIGDPLLTPVSASGTQTAAVDINASIYQMLVNGDEIQRLPAVFSYLVNTLTIFLLLLIIPRLSIFYQIAFSLLSLLLLLVLSWLVMEFGYWFPIAGVGFAVALIPFAWNAIRLSRLFSYFRKEARLLEQRRREEVFHFPDQLSLQSREQLERLLDTLAVSHYRLLKGRLHADEPGSTLDIRKWLPLVIAGEEYQLVVEFQHYGQREKRQLHLLMRWLESSDVQQAEDDSAGVSSDIFSRQLQLVQGYQDYIAASQHLFESSIQGLSSAVLVADLSGHLLFRNEQAFRLLPGQSENLFELLEVCQLAGRLQWPELWCQAILDQCPVTAEARLEPFDVSISLRCLEDNSARLSVLVVNISDISQVKRAQRARNEMIDFISHDMRSPIASLQALVRQAEASPATFSRDEFLRKVDSHSRRALNFAEEFLSLAKVESEENIQVYEVDMYSVSQNAADTLYEQAREKHIELVLTVDDDCWVMGNGDLLERVILNLASNAIKYSPEQTRVDIRITDSGDNIRVAVADQGEGIPADLLPDLFKSFQRGTGEREVKSKGLGLGLRFVDVALQRHASQIHVASSSSGCCFYFELPKLSF